MTQPNTEACRGLARLLRYSARSAGQFLTQPMSLELVASLYQTNWKDLETSFQRQPLNVTQAKAAYHQRVSNYGLSSEPTLFLINAVTLGALQR